MSIPFRIARPLRRPQRVSAILARAGQRCEAFWNWLLEFQSNLQNQFFEARAGRGIGFTRLCFERLEPRSLLTATWTGAGDGIDWSDAANWAGNVGPTTGDTVIIGSGFANGTVDDISGLSIQSLSTSSLVSLAETLTVTGSVVANAAVQHGAIIAPAGDNLDLSGTLDDVTLGGDATVDGTSLTIEENLTLSGGATLHLNNDAQVTFSGVGSLDLDGTGTVAFGGAGASQISVEGGHTPTTAATLVIGPNVTIDSAGASGVIEHNTPLDTINNEGTIDADVAGQTLTLATGVTAANNGTLEASKGGTLAIGAVLENNTSVTIDSASKLDLSGTLMGGTLAIQDTVPLAGSGTLDGVTLSGSLLLSGTSLTVEDGLTLGSGATLLLNNAAQATFSGTGAQNLDGTGTVAFGGTNPSQISVQGGGSLSTAASLVIGPDVTIHSAGAGGEIENATSFDSIDNQGTIDADVAGQTLNISSLSSNSGTIAAGVGGTVAINGPLVEDPTGTISIDIGGAAPGQFGQINATGAATLGGTLNLNQANGYTPGAGDSIQIMSFGGHTGNFATVNSTQIAGQPLFTATTNPNDVTVTAATADLSITKVDNVGGSSISGATGSVAPGSVLTYTIVVSNSGPSDAVGAAVADTMPAGISDDTWIATSTGGATGFSASGSGAIDDTAVNLPVGSTVTYTVTANVSALASGTLSNTATVTPPDDANITNTFNNSATDTDTLIPAADLSITDVDNLGGSSISGVTGSAVPGNQITYAIVITNGGDNDVAGASVSDPLPANLTGVTYSATSTGGASGFTTSGAGNIDDTAVDMPVGSTITYIVHGTINPSATGSLTNVASVATFAVSTGPPPAGNTATDVDDLSPTADLSITNVDGVGGSSITAAQGTVAPGAPITYTIVVTNGGPSNVTGATVDDLFPNSLAGVTYTATATGGANGFSASGSGDIDDGAVDMPAGSTVTYTVHATVVNSATGTVTNVAGVIAPELATDPTPGNNSASDVDDVLATVTAKPDSAATPEDTPVTVDVLANDQSSGSALMPNSVVVTSGPQFGSAIVHSDGTITYTPNVGYSGADRLTYTVENSLGMTSNPAQVDLRVAPAVSQAVVVSIDCVSHAEVNSGTTPFVFDVKLSAPSSQPVTVAYATFDGTATTADHDYLGTSGTLTFAPGVTDQQITVLVNGDTIYELDETFSVKLTSIAGATIGASVGTGTILNDDAPPTLSIDNVSVIKPLAGPAKAIFVVTLTGPSEVPLSVHYATVDGTAVAGIDYSATSGTLNFAASPAGTPMQQTITVQILPTLSQATNLTFDVVLSNTVNATLTAPFGIGTIIEFAQAQPAPVSPLPAPQVAERTIPLVTLPSPPAVADVPAARLAANNRLFALYGGDSSLLLKKDQPRTIHDLTLDLDDLRDEPSMPEERGQDIVLALALTTVPQPEGSTLSDERPDPQKLLHLAALETALPLPVAPIEQERAESSQSWWVKGSSALVLAVSSAVLLAPRLRGKGRMAIVGHFRKSAAARSNAVPDPGDR